LGSYKLLPVLGADHYIENTEQSPLPAMNFVMKNYAGKNVLNDWNFGGRMIYESKGTFPVMLDGRAGTAYTEDQLSDYLKFVELSDGWQQMLDDYKIDALFIINGRGFAKDYDKGLYRENWQEVYKDDVARVFTRKQ
jgi:hypothetical protein